MKGLFSATRELCIFQHEGRNEMKDFLPLLVLTVLLALMSCGGNTRTSVTVIEKEANLGVEGLNLQAVGELAKTARSAEELERALNQPGGINNLDLDHDGQANYINVLETKNQGSQYSFALSTKLKNGTTVELASIQIDKVDDSQASMAVTGNPQYYGNNGYYHSTIPLGDLLLLSWLLAPHPIWYHPAYSYGYYPSYYHVYQTVPRTTYVTRTVPYTSNSSFSQPAKSLSNQTSSQKSFQARDTSKPIGTGGFGTAPAKSPAPLSTPRTTRIRSGSFGKRR